MEHNHLEKAEKIYPLTGNLGLLDNEQKLHIIRKICSTYKLDALTRPIQVIRMGNTEILYFTKHACDMIANRLKLTRNIISEELLNDGEVVKIVVKIEDETGRNETSVNFYPLSKFVFEKGVRKVELLRGSDWCDAMKKAYSGAMRRGTLAFIGYEETTEISNEIVEEKKETIVGNYIVPPSAPASTFAPAPAPAPAPEPEPEPTPEPTSAPAPESKSEQKQEATNKSTRDLAKIEIKKRYTTIKNFTAQTGRTLEEVEKAVDFGGLSIESVLDSIEKKKVESEQQEEVIYLDIENREHKSKLLDYIEEVYPNWSQDKNTELYKDIVAKVKNTKEKKVIFDKETIINYLKGE